MRWQEMAEIDVWSSELQLRAADKNMVDEDVHCALSAVCRSKRSEKISK